MADILFLIFSGFLQLSDCLKSSPLAYIPQPLHLPSSASSVAIFNFSWNDQLYELVFWSMGDMAKISNFLLFNSFQDDLFVFATSRT